MIYENKFGKVDILPDPDFWDGHIIGIAMSGGADSLMLCYLVANTIKKLKLNSSIQPYNGYDIHVPHDSNAAVKTLPTLIRKFPTVDIKWPISTVFNSNGEDNKMDYITKLRKALAGATFTRHITGITLGPPYKVQNSWPKTVSNQRIRRIPNYMSESESAWDDWPLETTPFKNIDKRFVIQCYKDFKQMKLFHQTVSCTTPTNGNKPCGKCWWDYEREWALNEVQKRI